MSGVPTNPGYEAWACGKAILLGEHAVVHGSEALVAALPRAMCARDEGPARSLDVVVRPWGLEATAASTEDTTGVALAALAKAIALRGVAESDIARRVSVRAWVPPRAGLGSSAALAVCLCRVLASRAEGPRLTSYQEVTRLAAVSETIFHGSPSGVDVAAAASEGGVGSYSRSKGLCPIPFSQPLHLVVASSGARPEAREMIAHVDALTRASPKARADLDRLGDLSTIGASMLRSQDLAGLGAAMTEAHALLSSLELSTAKLDRLVSLSMERGALGAKLTGAGGGGCMVALCTKDSGGEVLRGLEGQGVWARAFTVESTSSTPFENEVTDD